MRDNLLRKWSYLNGRFFWGNKNQAGELKYRVSENIKVANDVVKKNLNTKSNPDKKREITPQLIIDTVAEDFGVNPEDITSKKRSAEFVLPRQVVMYLCRNLTEVSLINIAKILNKKDHTTILHGSNKIDSDMKTNSELKERIDIITKKLNPQ